MATIYGTDFRDIFEGDASTERVFGRAGDDDLFGNGGDDILVGEAGDDLLVGGTGTDRLYGGEGSDMLAGEAGNDVLDGGTGFDLANYLYAARGVSVDLARGVAIDGDGGRDRLVGLEAVSGSRFADRIVGTAGTNELFGNGGNDIITGGGGQDYVAGGAGADRFVFADGDVSSTLAGADLIDDFYRSDRDRIDLRGLDANTTTTADDAFTFIGTAAFTGIPGQLRYSFAAGDTILTGDVDGDGAADLYIRLSEGPALVVTDFFL